MPVVTPIKGKAIVFCSGQYDGKTGWLNDAQPYQKYSSRIAVIVDLGNGMLTATSVSPNSIRSASMKPKNYAQAACIEQHDIIEKIRAATNKLAACCLTEEDVANATDIFAGELRMSIKRQAAKGSKARWIDLVYRRVVRAKREAPKTGSVGGSTSHYSTSHRSKVQAS